MYVWINVPEPIPTILNECKYMVNPTVPADNIIDNNVEKAMRKLKKMLLKEGVMQELRDRRYYMKPSFVKREDKKRAIRRAKKLQREQEMAEFGIVKKKAKRR